MCGPTSFFLHLTIVSKTTESPSGAGGAPSPAGDYTLRVHVASSTVVGVALAQEVPFTVQEDDVPELE